jgi:hypothetical protein
MLTNLIDKGILVGQTSLFELRLATIPLTTTPTIVTNAPIMIDTDNEVYHSWNANDTMAYLY